ncbi:MAG: DUF938 domain-containing protein [Gammaproteobacteria bacterium]|nr:DUF938 domain-containing protein [Gammaproteobacteria bacterium]
MPELNFSAASERNKDAILAHIRPVLREASAVLEVGSGTGQHGEHFAAEMPWLIWQTSDLEEHHAGLKDRIAAAGLDNLRKPLSLDVLADPWPDVYYDAVFTANTLHIIPWDGVLRLVEGAAARLVENGLFIVYGPFLVAGQPTSDSNAAFDAALRRENPEMGIRELENLLEFAASCGLTLLADCALPANNRLLLWQKPAC